MTLLSFVSLLFSMDEAQGRRPFIQTTERILEKVETVQGIRLPKGTRMSLTSNGQIYYLWPGADITISGILLREGSQSMVDEKGELLQFWCEEGQKIFSFRCPKKTWVVLKTGMLSEMHLSGPAEYNGFLLDSGLQTYRDGKLREGTLAKPQVWKGVPLAANRVGFYPSGQIRYGYLSAPWSGFPVGEEIHWNEKGAVIGVFPSLGGSTGKRLLERSQVPEGP